LRRGKKQLRRKRLKKAREDLTSEPKEERREGRAAWTSERKRKKERKMRGTKDKQKQGRRKRKIYKTKMRREKQRIKELAYWVQALVSLILTLKKSKIPFFTKIIKLHS
jgi:hypothetical protein